MAYQRIPSLNWLRVFEAAARAESFAGAGRILNMSPAAVSQQIRALESHLDTQLFTRGQRSVTLTESGLAFIPTVRQSILSLETTAAALFGQTPRRGGVLNVQSTLIFLSSWLTPRLNDFTAQHPDIQLHITSGNDSRDFVRRGAELRILFGGVSHEWGESDRLMGETIYPVATPDIAKQIQTPTDLLQHRLLEVSSHRTSWLQLFEQCAITSIDQAHFNFADSSEITLNLAAEGFGIALARAPVTDARVERYGLVPCLPDTPPIKGGESFHLVYRTAAGLSPAAQRFRAWLLDAI